MGSPDASPRAAVFERLRVVEDADVDALGHVHNVVWVRFVVELAEAHAEALGVGIAALGRQGLAWVVRRHDVVYRANAAPGARIRERTWIEALRGARCVRRSRFATSGGERLVEATTEWVLVDLGRLRPRRIPPALAARLPVAGAEPAGPGS